MKIIRYDHPKSKLPAPFLNEGAYVKIVPEKSFFEKVMKDIGYERFLKHASSVVGPNFQVVTTWCIDHKLKSVARLPPFGHLNCVNCELCLSDLECLSHLVGNVNPVRLIIATQLPPETYRRVARLPLIGYNAQKVLIYYDPSPEQLQFAERPEGARLKLVSDEAASMDKKVRKLKLKEKRSI